MPLNTKKIKLSKKELEKLAEALKKRNKKTEKEIMVDENKFIESGIVLEKISPVLKPVAKTQEGLEQISSSFLLQRKQENQDNEKPYESEKQKYSSQSGEYKTLNKIQTENLQNPTGVEKNMSHMGFEQSQKRKSERFFDEKQEQKYSADIKPLEEVKEKRKNNFYTPTRDPVR